MCGGSFPVPRPEVPAGEFLPPPPRGNICPHPHKSPWESAGMDASSPIPAPKSHRGSFYLHLHSHVEKILIFGALNGAIPAGIRSNGCKLTSLDGLVVGAVMALMRLNLKSKDEIQ
ncbi:hypothetical protein L195_g033502, partial [Trifolium pratense]